MVRYGRKEVDFNVENHRNSFSCGVFVQTLVECQCFPTNKILWRKIWKIHMQKHRRLWRIHKPSCNLFLSAGIKPDGVKHVTIPSTMFDTSSQFKMVNDSIFSNIGCTDIKVVSEMWHCFSVSRGTYRSRIRECFSPVYWVRCILFFPQIVFSYLGLQESGTPAKIAQVLYWFLVPLLVTVRTEIYRYLIELLSKS